MRKPPDIKQFPRFPVSAATCLLAIAVTFAFWGHWNVEPLLEDGNVRRWQLWRLITSALPHTSPYHLIFNVYWTWVFGTLIEEVFGHFKTAAIFIFLALGSGAAEYALMSGGVGLSGVGYGLFGMLWVLSRRDARFAGAVDGNTVALFVIWFFICIVLDVTGAMPIANVAHGAGALLGGIVGWAISARGTARTVSASMAALFVVAAVGGATIARPWVNFAKDGSHGEFELGFEALTANRNEEALRWFRDVTRMSPKNAPAWFNLAIAYERTGSWPDAIAAYERAHRLEPSNSKYLQTWLESAGALAFKANDFANATHRYEELTRAEPSSAEGWYWLAESYGELNRSSDALAAFRKAVEIDPMKSRSAATYTANKAYRALTAQNYLEAERWALEATKYAPAEPSYWYNLGIAYQGVGKGRESLEAYERAHKLAPEDQTYKDAIDAHQSTTRAAATAPSTPAK